jgi:alpha-beta hydrolase superfamily lysophospholipase
MQWGEVKESRSVLERDFTLSVEGRTVPGILWQAGGAEPGAPLVLIGHGGTEHKRADYVLALARMLARHHGIASFAIDAPGHGDRATQPMSSETFDEIWSQPNVDDETVADWRGALAAVTADISPGSLGYWGLSQGTMMGVPVVAALEDIRVAVLGLMGLTGFNARRLGADAPRISCPVRFLLQWDDEIVDRQSGLDLFDALGTQKKDLRAHPGLHSAVPPPAFRDTVTFLAGHLLA